MKILQAGNLANLGYVTTRQLRRDQMDVELLMERQPPKNSDPIEFDPLLQNKYPDWIIFYDKRKRSWKTDIIKIMRNQKYDLIHAYTELPIFAYLSRRPFIVQATGSDFRELAFTNSLRGILLRRAYKSAKVIIFSSPSHAPLFDKLKLTNGINLVIPWDYSFFKPQKIDRTKYSDKLVIFHPANLEWRLKGNNILIEGFAEFLKKNPNSLLIIVDRGIDSDKTHQLVDSLDIRKNVQFIKGPLNSSELLIYYNVSDIVADQFVLSGLGLIGREALSCEKPLLTKCPENVFGNLYPEPPPVINASTPIEISKKLEYLSDEKNRKEISKNGYRWFIKYHSMTEYSTKLRRIYEGVLCGKNVEQIRESLVN